MFTYISLDGDPKGAPPGNPTPDWKDRFAARQKVAQVLINIARTSPKVCPEVLFTNADVVKRFSSILGGCGNPFRKRHCEMLSRSVLSFEHLPIHPVISRCQNPELGAEHF